MFRFPVEKGVKQMPLEDEISPDFDWFPHEGGHPNPDLPRNSDSDIPGNEPRRDADRGPGYRTRYRAPNLPRKRRSRRRRKGNRHYVVTKLRPRVRERLLPLKPLYVGREVWRDGPDIYYDQTYTVPMRPLSGDGSYITERTWDYIHPGPPFRSGGPFRRIRVLSPWMFVQGRCHVDNLPSGIQRSYDGGFLPTRMGDDQLDDYYVKHLGRDVDGEDTPYGLDYADPSVYGAEAYQKFKPKLEGLDLPVSLFELRELPDMLRQTARGFHLTWKAMGGHPTLFKPDEVAGQFLNYQFGWKPFLKDVVDFHKTYTNLDRDLDQIKKDNGQWVRRHGTVLKDDSILRSYTDHDLRAAYVFPALTGHLYRDVWDPVSGHNVSGQSTFTTFRKRRVSFAGQFRYYVPLFDDVKPSERDNASYYDVFRSLRRFGVRVSPSLVYKATPWSWLVDWFSNVGSVVDNLSTFFLDGQISSYAYIMEHREIVVQHDAKIFLRDQDVSCSWNQIIDSKRREEASPYGFNLKPDDLSLRQKLILAAVAAGRS